MAGRRARGQNDQRDVGLSFPAPEVFVGEKLSQRLIFIGTAGAMVALQGSI